VITEGATSYVPQIGKALEGEEVAPPGIPYGSGGGSPYTFQEEAWNMQGAQREANEAPGLELGRETEAAIAAALAAGIDPHGLLTGSEALTLGNELVQEAKNLNYYLNEEGHCSNALFPKACELYFESGEAQDKKLASALKECNFQVHNGGWLHGHYYTKTCLLSFSYSLFLDNRVVEPGWHVNICFSFRVTPHVIVYSSTSWFCESDDKWWTFSNRGFWNKY
jgi:hypothetical protein